MTSNSATQKREFFGSVETNEIGQDFPNSELEKKDQSFNDGKKKKGKKDVFS